MKISYILQLKDFFIVFGIGFIIGIIYGFLNIFSNIKKLYVIQIIVDIIFSIIYFISFLILVNILNWGQVRLFLVVGYLLGFILERITLGKIFAKCYKRVYNNIVKICKKLVRSKIGKIIFK